VNTLAIELEAESGPSFPNRYSLMQMITSRVEFVGWRLVSRWTDSKRDHERVELAFASLELRSICESRRRATNLLGAEAARELTQRLADLSAFATAAEVSDLFPGDIVDRSRSERALRLQAGHDLVFCAGHVDVPVLKDGSTDWTKVSRLRIIALEARHD
jgi:hypothetical protein